MTLIVVLLCLIVAGLELYIGLGRNRRPSANAGRISELEAARSGMEERLAAEIAGRSALAAELGAVGAELAALRTAIGEQLTATRTALEVRVAADAESAKQAQQHMSMDLAALEDGFDTDLRGLEERLDVRLTGQDESLTGLRDRLDRLDQTPRTADHLRDQIADLAARLDREFAPALTRIQARLEADLEAERTATLGGRPDDAGTVSGALGGDLSPLTEVPARYRDLLARFDLRVKLEVAEHDGTRYYLACPPGHGPVELEWDFITLLDGVRGPATPNRSGERAALEALLAAVRDMAKGFVQIGPLVIVRTPETMLAGVLSVSESRSFDTAAMLSDLPGAAGVLLSLPDSRLHDLTHWCH